MKTGKPYWSLRIDNASLKQSMPNQEYKDLRKKIYAEISALLSNQFDFATEAEAKAARKKLSKPLQQWVAVRELTPISLGLGWC